MGRCRYGQPIRTRLEEARAEERRVLVFEGDEDEGREIEEVDDGGDKDEDSEIEEEKEGSEDEGDEDEKKEGGGSEDEEEEDEKKEGGGSEDEEDEDEGDEDKEPKACDSHWWIPSPLIPLEGTGVVPKVSYPRVVYENGTNMGNRSDMTREGLRCLAKRFPWPKGVELRLPCATGGALAKYPGCIVVYEYSLTAGFRLPLHPIIRDFLSLKNYCPAQLTPSSWRYIVAVLLKFKEMNLVPSYEAFKSFYEIPSNSGIHTVSLHPINHISNPRAIGLWGSKWFLVKQSEVFSFNFPMYPGDHRWCKGYTVKKDDKEKATMKKFLNSLPDLKANYQRVVTLRRLEEAGLSLPRPVKGSSIWVQHIGKRKREVSCSMSDLKRMKYLREKAKKTLLPLTSIPVGIESVDVAHEEDEEEEEPQEDEEEEPQEEEEEVDESKTEEEEEKDRVELASTGPQQSPIEPASISSTRLLNGEKEVCQEGGIDVPVEGGRLSSFPPASEWINSINTILRPEVSTALRQLPELIFAVQRSEQLEHELDESRKQNVELEAEKVELKCQIDELRRRGMLLADALTRKERELAAKESELATKERDFESQIKCMELEKKTAEEKLTQTVQMATELIQIASPPNPK